MGQFRHSRKLAQSVDVNVSELMHRTLEELDKDSAAGENSKVQQWQRNIRLVLVDDAHNLDPAAAQFIEGSSAPTPGSSLPGTRISVFSTSGVRTKPSWNVIPRTKIAGWC